MTPISEFSGGADSVRNKLNQLVQAVNALMLLRGDEQFIGIDRTTVAATVRLNINQVLARIPKIPPPRPFYGSLSLYWIAGQAYVTLTPCLAYNDATPTGDANVKAFIYGDMATVPPNFLGNLGAIFEYDVVDSTTTPVTAKIHNPPIIGVGGAAAQVYQMDSLGATGVWDFPKAK